VSVTVCGVVGASGSGKTLLIQRLVPALSEQGLAVGYLKHAAHGFRMDREGTDTARVHDAGAAEVLIAGDGSAAHLWYAAAAPGSPGPFLARMANCDLVLVEGFTSADHPKIRVTAAGAEPRDATPPILLDLERGGPDWDDAAVDRATTALVELAATPSEPVVSMVADGVEVPMHRFATRIVAATLAGLTSQLKGVDRPHTLTVTVRMPATDDGP